MRNRSLLAAVAVAALSVGLAASKAMADVTLFTASAVSTQYVLGSSDGQSWSVIATCAKFPITDAGYSPPYCATTNVALNAGANTAIQGWSPQAVPLIKAQNGL